MVLLLAGVLCFRSGSSSHGRLPRLRSHTWPFSAHQSSADTFLHFFTRWLYLPGLVRPRIFLLAWTTYNPTTKSWFLVSVSEDQGLSHDRCRIFHSISIICWQSRLLPSSFCSCTAGSSAKTWAFLLRLPPLWDDASSLPKLLLHLMVWLFEFLPVWYVWQRAKICW